MTTGQELLEHVQRLGRDLDVPVWTCLNCKTVGGEAVEVDGARYITVSQIPDTVIPYQIALHELGHHADPAGFKGLRLDREAWAWRWALEHALIDLDWTDLYTRLTSYIADRRFKRTPDFDRLVAEAERNL